MNVKNFSMSRRAGVISSSLLALSVALPLAALAEENGTLAAMSNYVKFSGQKAWVNDSGSAWQTETRHTKSGAGGIEDLKIEQKINEKDSLQIEGRALPGDEDYYGLARFKVEELATVEVGYKSFRTYYDGVGGFFPTNGAWKPLADQYLHVDRSNFWIDSKIALPDKPVIHLRYSNERRSGQKDSTIWGDTDQTGMKLYAPYTAWSSGARKIVGSYIDLDERQQTFEASAQHTIGKTKITLAAVGTLIKNADTRVFDRYPGELQVYDPVTKKTLTISSTTVSPETKANNHVNISDLQAIDNQTWAFTGKFETTISDKVSVFGGVTNATTNGTVFSDRRGMVDLSTAVGTVTSLGGIVSGNATTYFTSTGSDLDQSVTTGNLGCNFKPVTGLFITTALKAEHSTVKVSQGLTTFGTVVNQTTGVTTPATTTAVYNNSCHNKEDVWVPEVSARYNGIRTVSIYGDANYRNAPGTENALYRNAATSDKVAENHGNYKLGVSWNPAPVVTLRAETFLKNHENRVGDYSQTNGFYIFNSSLKGAVLSATVTPSPEVSATTRYTIRSGSTEVLVNNSLGSYDASTSKIHQISETLNWTPNKDYYIQLDVGFVFDNTNTAYKNAGDITTGTAAAPVYRFANQVLRDATNDYWTGSAVAGVNVDSATSVELKYSLYRADNYQPGIAAYTLPYGVSEKNSTITAGVKHKFSEKLAGEAKIGYFKSDNATSGHNSDYSGTLAYVSLTQAF